MLLKVPFYVQGHNECGPASLQMVLEFLGFKKEREEIKKLLDSESKGATWTIDLARAATKLGFKVEFYSTSLDVNTENFELDYYKKETDSLQSVQSKLRNIIDECKKNGVSLQEKSLKLNEILSRIDNNCLAIALIDWGKIAGTEGYIGHIVPIIGYDEECVYIHQPGPKNPEANYKVKKELFDVARKARGTDEDILFICR
ncbi:MAG TPA: peptidase C39 family protein [Candidatus Nanoarchaeia archaeon]|nr:peptidase C39 family protein [Candidatus Nanoarchaeia archaeon]